MENTQEKPLTLQQKFVKLREAIPALTKKEYSDGVKYKFLKISDIYEHLTPAMNACGVNFDVIKETATRHAENGDALFYHSYQQQTRNGQRTVWVYEADLTLQWINVDNPVDSQEVTLHAIGTNDGGPDKAKGSAWTYCLKYYLFEKFGIDQGEDDPDNDQTEGTVQTGSGKNNAGNNNGGNKKLSEPQIKRLYKLGGDAGYSPEQVHEYIEKKYQQANPYELHYKQYNELCSYLQKLAKDKGGK